jgi:hypothetical protein
MVATCLLLLATARSVNPSPSDPRRIVRGALSVLRCPSAWVSRRRGRCARRPHARTSRSSPRRRQSRASTITCRALLLEVVFRSAGDRVTQPIAFAESVHIAARVLAIRLGSRSPMPVGLGPARRREGFKLTCPLRPPPRRKSLCSPRGTGLVDHNFIAAERVSHQPVPGVRVANIGGQTRRR